LQQHTAFVFPGQGSQRLGMLSDASDAFPAVRATFEEAADALGLDLWGLTQGDDAERLNLTENTQPALLCTSVALWRAWDEAGGPRPGAMAGHSLGEFSALCCAGAIDFPDALRLVQQRGRFMQSAVPAGVGAMSAVIGLDDERIIAVCAKLSSSDHLVEAVNFNSPGQVVIAGHAAAVADAGEKLLEAGARRVLPLPVSAPFHTALMRPAGEKLGEVLESITLRTPEIPVLHNVTCDSEADPAAIRRLLVRQISAPVPWTGCVESLRDRGYTRQVECGAGKVLTGLLRRIDRALTGYSTEAPDDLHAAVAAVSDNEESAQ
jgi:[acyl-carrier-protein] S-malonyltransferase